MRESPWLVLPCLVIVACASIMHGTHQNVGVSSVPPAATVFDNGVQAGKTPAILELKRNKPHTIRIELVGYKPFEVILTQHVSGWIVGNIIFGGLIGIIVDAANGAMYNLRPESVAATLTAEQKVALARGEIVILATFGADPTWQKIGDLERLK